MSGLTLILDDGEIAVVISCVGDPLSTAVWQSHVIRSVNRVAIAVFFMAEIIVRFRILHFVGETVRFVRPYLKLRNNEFNF